MPTTETFYVAKSDGKLRKTSNPSRDHFPQYPATESEAAEAEYIIEVFGYNHKEEAKKVQQMVENSEFDGKLFKIKVETR